MEAGQRFGNYVLFKRLSEDAFGESYRAGQIGARGVERVVLLRLFNHPDIDRQALSELLAGRESLQAVLKSPHLGEGVELGVEGGTPFVTYEYLSGRNLEQLQRQAREKPFPIPIEHALFVIERMALGLAAAHDTRFKGERLVHGFLSPSWVWLSSEGEVRLLGMDVADALRALPESVRQGASLLPYLAPEVAAGDAPLAADDVYSLGAVLFELLTGTPVPVENPLAAVGSGVVAAEGTALPADIQQLLAQSLGPRAQRTPTVDKWRAALSHLISEGDYSPTTFNLAFFLHTLFRGEIDQESQEIERERAGQIPAAAPVEAAEAPPEESFVDLEIAEPPTEESAELTPSRSRRVAGVARASAEEGKKKVLLIGAAAALVAAALGVGGYLYYSRQPGDPAAASGEPVAAPDPLAEATDPEEVSGADPAIDPTALAGGEEDASLTGEPVGEAQVPAAGAPSGGPEPSAVSAAALDAAEPPPTPEELEQRVRQLVARGVDEMETSLKSDYEARLAELRRQLEEARKATASAPPEKEEEGAVATQEVTRPPAAAPAERKASVQGGAADTEGAQTPAAAGSETATQAAADQEAEAQAAAAPPPKPEPVKRGDLVQPGAGVIPPSIVSRPRPVYPPAARKFAKTATVKLRVLVDENGKPSRIERLSERARFGFDEAAERAARGTSWKAATKNGVAVKMWVELTIDFRP